MSSSGHPEQAGATGADHSSTSDQPDNPNPSPTGSITNSTGAVTSIVTSSTRPQPTADDMYRAWRYACVQMGMLLPEGESDDENVPAASAPVDYGLEESSEEEDNDDPEDGDYEEDGISKAKISTSTRPRRTRAQTRSQTGSKGRTQR